MSIELDQFKATYMQEAAELLEDMEERLVNLDQNNVDLEEINAIFRCAHSIKGGGGAFGFSRLVSFTHILEFLLDALRNSEIEINPDIIDALLKSVDVVGALLNEAKTGASLPAGYEDELLETLKSLSSAKSGAVPETSEKPKNEIAAPKDSSQQKTLSNNKIYHISFKPNRELFASGNEPVYIIRELQKNSQLTTSIDISKVPDIYDLDVEDCYLKWDIYAQTTSDEKIIKEAFEFVEDECKLEIKQVESVPTSSFADDDNGAFGFFEENIAAANNSKTLEDPDGAFGLFDDVTTATLSKSLEDADGAFGLFEEPKPAIQTDKPVEPIATPKVENKTANTPAAAAQKDESVTSIRVDISKIDKMVNMVGELVITQAMIMQRLKDIPQEYLQGLMQGVTELSRHTRELQESVMAVRMQPVKSVFSRMPRIVRDLSRKLNKQVRLEMKGEATEIDKTVIERLTDPLTHMIRNSLDHGIETPDVRTSKGKPAEGTIMLSADSTGGRIIIEISDDGNGINREKVLKKAKEKGLVSADAQPSPEEIDNMIFMAGFSTADVLTDVSGRGVGMDVVRRNIKDLGGEIQMINNPGFGSKFSISLPLTLAILDGMIIQVGVEKYIIPISNIIETMRLNSSEIQRVKEGSEVINVRGEFIPIAHLHKLFNVPNVKNNSDKILVVLVEVAKQKIGIVVDDLLGQQQVVIKNLEENADHVDGVSGATILGDGNVSLILDIAQILKMATTTKNIKLVA